GPDLRFRWYHDGAILPGEQSAVLTIPTFKAAYAGRYRCEITNDYGSVHSRVATVRASAGTPGTLANLSVRGFSGTGADLLTGGFVSAGAAKAFLIRSI